MLIYLKGHLEDNRIERCKCVDELILILNKHHDLCKMFFKKKDKFF